MSFVSGPTFTKVLKHTSNYDLDTGTYKLALLKSSYTPNPDHEYMADVASHECDATNYTGGYGGSGRKTIASPSVTYDSSLNRVVWDFDNPATWVDLGGATNNTLRYGVILKEITDDAASPIFAVLDMTAIYSTTGGDFTASFSSEGVVYFPM